MFFVFIQPQKYTAVLSKTGIFNNFSRIFTTATLLHSGSFPLQHESSTNNAIFWQKFYLLPKFGSGKNFLCSIIINHNIMARNYFNRYIWLIDLIQRSGYISFEEINRAWQRSSLNRNGERLSERTFFNHKDAIFDTFGIEIKCDRSLGYYINNEEDVESDSLKNWMLQSLSLNSIMNEGSDLRDRIICEDIPSSQKWLPDIMAAMRDGKKLTMTYQSFWKNTSHTYDVSPYCLKLFKQRWYMLAKSDAYKEPRIYALDRILDLKQTKTSFKLPKGFEPKDVFRKLFGVILDNGPVEEVIIRVSDDQVKYYRTLPLHHSQEEGESGDGYTEFRYRLVPTFDFCRELLSKGMYVEVMSPVWLRKEIANELRQTVKMYNDVPDEE